jgi:hypothetical protein
MKENIKFYSQMGQDQIVVNLFKGKTNGTFLDIGCGDPENINNTLTLEKYFSWTGLSIDLNEEVVKEWESIRSESKFLLTNALEIDYASVLRENNLPLHVDFLSIDLEPPTITFDVLKKIPLNEITFNVIAYEHDGYRMGHEFKQNTRDYIQSFGYVLFKELNNQDDIYLHNSFVDSYK